MKMGRLVLVVGPSGAGKDTLIRGARRQLGDDPRFVFVRRAITRASSVDEECIELDRERFATLAAEGAFTLHWTAHGLSYGLPRAIEDALKEGHIVVANVSRGVVQEARDRFKESFVIEVTASDAELARRLAQRARPEDGDLNRRFARRTEVSALQPDAKIFNDTTPENSTSGFVRLLCDLADAHA
ncbi:ribose 1,5-bisphosphokinase [Arboricoccus pini]|uniref:ribose 1,5-bisphosphate phosphokinase n=1 Tax=Arboricoccus pini TaxID=1963835 RepID=A0A212R2D0_9PROT|nr:phosphonate metabolism protein/1,5-bisphosphokinase (PRPP-forming) PhnN [Arboricoccus pini]SNB66008.1 ribose 1,5-bisphosphokinase [Arboricoccus pini]